MAQATTEKAEAPLHRASVIGAIGLGIQEGIANQPFCADVETSLTRALPDGTQAEDKQVEYVCRDSRGRTRIEQKQPFKKFKVEGANGTTIYDLPSKVSYTIDDSKKTVVKSAMTLQSTAPPVTKQANPNASAESGATPAWTQEDLGTNVIDGVEVIGHRVTKTIPAGEVGNEEPAKSVRETWFSLELKSKLKEKRSDPKTGEVVTEVTSVVRGEPDAKLFVVPAGYEVKEAR